MIRLAGTGRVYVTTQAFDAGARISRYLLMQLIVNATYGAAVATGLAVIGVPSAMLWGLLAGVMRFVPYVGPWIAAVLPIALSLAVFEGWYRPLATVVLVLILELVSNNIMEPWLYGSSAGVSTVGIIASAVFWTWLWGPLGLVLATPLTVCLTVLGRHVPRLGFLNVLLSDEPALPIDVRFYQRLLALDYNEASDLVAQFLKTATLDDLYEQLFVPALSLAERDRHVGHLTPDQAEFIYRSVSDFMREAERPFDTSAASETIPPGSAAATIAAGKGSDSTTGIALRIMCLPAEDEADRLAGAMLETLLRARGHDAHTADTRAASDQAAQRVRHGAVDWVVISGVAPGGAMQARDASRRLKAGAPEIRIVVGLWNAAGSLEGTRERLTSAGADTVHTKFSEALAFIRTLAESRAGATERAAGITEDSAPTRG
jgi:methylmalonyl-CoA mutase cobalamin-binding subunit